MTTEPLPKSEDHQTDGLGSASALRAGGEVGDELTKLTVNLTPRSVVAMNDAAARLGDTRTDTVNRALQLYANLTALEVGQGFTYEVRDGEPVTVLRVRGKHRRRVLPAAKRPGEDGSKNASKEDNSDV